MAAGLVSEALHALVCTDCEPDTNALERCVAQLAEPAARQVVERLLWDHLKSSMAAAWRGGWQPAELVRHMGRELSARHGRMAGDVIAALMRSYSAARVDERWAAQLTALGAQVWWERDSDWLASWAEREGVDHVAAVTCVVRVLSVLVCLPRLPVLCPPPGEARRGSLAAGGRTRETAPKMLERVRALLAKAESTEFTAEAEALTKRAQELMARHSIDYALLAAQSGNTEEPAGRRVPVDNPYADPKAVLLAVVADANHCRAVFDPGLGLSTVLGFPEDLDAVELMFTSLLVQATTAMVAAGSQRDRSGRSRTRSFRQSFLAAYAQRIGERLAEATGQAIQEAVRQTAGSPGTDLVPVLAARDRAVDDATADMFPEVTHRATRVRDYDGWISGRAVADLASLSGHQEGLAAGRS